MYWSVLWKNDKRNGLSGAEADSEAEAREQVRRRIEEKYYWQGKCRIKSCTPAKEFKK